MGEGCGVGLVTLSAGALREVDGAYSTVGNGTLLLILLGVTGPKIRGFSPTGRGLVKRERFPLDTPVDAEGAVPLDEVVEFARSDVIASFKADDPAMGSIVDRSLELRGWGVGESKTPSTLGRCRCERDTGEIGDWGGEVEVWMKVADSGLDSEGNASGRDESSEER